MYTSSKHGIIWGIEGHEEDARAPTCQSCHLLEGNHEVKTAWGFLGLRIPTKENVLALIEVAPDLKESLTKLAAALPSGNYLDVDDDPQWTFDRALILQAAGILDANLQPTERFVEIVVQAEAARGTGGVQPDPQRNEGQLQQMPCQRLCGYPHAGLGPDRQGR